MEDSLQVPVPIVEFCGSAGEIENRIIEALEVITRARVPVWMLYWPEDGFVAYPDSLVKKIRSTVRFQSKLRISCNVLKLEHCKIGDNNIEILHPGVWRAV